MATAAGGGRPGRLNRAPAAAGLTLQRQQIRTLAGSFNAGRSQLAGLLHEVGLARARLAQRVASESLDERALAQRLVAGYESDRGDADGAASSKLVAAVRAARAAVAAEATRFGALSLRLPQLAGQVAEDRERLGEARSALAAGRRMLPSSMPAQHVADAGSAGARQLAVSVGTGVNPAAQGAGPGFAFPMPEGDVAPPATWSLAGGGVDMAAPWDTPELAVCAGTVVLHGIGGLGRWTPVLHCDSPIAGHEYVYYGHAGAGHWTPIGTRVSLGQVISEVGPGIVGDSTGPDLDIGFADATGSPAGSADGQDMMRLLRTAYRS